MKKSLTLILCMMMAASVLLTACAAYKPSAGTMELPHFNGIMTADADGKTVGDGTYDSDVLAYPGNYTWGADNGVIFVSEEEARVSAEKQAEAQCLTGEAKDALISQYVSEYGNYFFMYSGTGQTKHHSTQVHEDGSYMHVLSYRSRDLYDWELVGVLDGGWCLYLESDSWIYHQLWAPEVIYNPNDGKYYMYFSAQTKVNDGSIPGATYSGKYEWYASNFAAGVACSDSPVGPFYMVSSERNYDGGKNPNGETLTHINPTIDWQKGLGLERHWPAIDYHPVWIDDGDPATFDLYLYFARHVSEELGIYANEIYGVRMLDMATPDFTTVRKLLGANYVQTITYLEGNPGLDSSYDEQEFANKDDINDARSICEAPFMMTTQVDGKTKYLLLSSPEGVLIQTYNVDIAIADDPLGPYTKLTIEQGREMLAMDPSNDFASNLGHCAIVQIGDDYYCCYGTAETYGGDVTGGRFNRVDKIGWYYSEELGYDLPVVNGPTNSLQALPEIASGYGNLADKAEISSVNMQKDSLKYLTDGVIPTQERLAGLEAVATSDEASITFTFEQAVTLRGIMIYNSYYFDNAFKKIDYITFELAEPVIIDGKSTKTVAIQDLPFDSSYFDLERKIMHTGSASVATFQEIKVQSVTITLSTHLNESAAAEMLRISEVMLIGKEG